MLSQGSHRRPLTALIAIGEEALKTFSYAELAPLMCAGATMYETMLAAKWQPGDVLVVQGLGGLGHLGIQYGHKLGMKASPRYMLPCLLT